MLLTPAYRIAQAVKHELAGHVGINASFIGSIHDDCPTTRQASFLVGLEDGDFLVSITALAPTAPLADYLAPLEPR